MDCFYLNTWYPAGHQLTARSNRGQADRTRQALIEGGWGYTVTQPTRNTFVFVAVCQ